MANKGAKACLLPMGITSENVAAQFKVSREDQDKLSVASHQKAGAAIKGGKFKDEIVPVTTKVHNSFHSLGCLSTCTYLIFLCFVLC
jgi:acetyl-CoA acyltransferase 1